MDYVPILMVFAVAAVVAGALLGIPALIAPRRTSRVKMEPFECGKDPVQLPEGRFSIKFSSIAIYFILFDIEAVFLYPWAVILKDLKAMGQGVFAISEMFVYIAIVLVGFFYIWKKGVLDWGLTVSSEVKRLSTAKAARIGGNYGQSFASQLAEIIHHHRGSEQMIHRDVEKTLNLSRVQVQRENTIRAGPLDQTCNQACRNRHTRPILTVLPGIPIIG